ncbi:uncharacterized protein LOC114195090 [Vigna unguiculata]|uniref:uncharacterized protein LOC114195090 n=1 Tax=Vigna unguiculata TaxID=3917 RepID=UPI001015F637|nr:uncharacterized protein LOC114195090 [Vigna unguiculata]
MTLFDNGQFLKSFTASLNFSRFINQTKGAALQKSSYVYPKFQSSRTEKAMQISGVYVLCDWTNLLCVEFLFQPCIWRVELLQDHPLHHDLLNFFLGCLTVQLMEINLILFIVAAIFCYCFGILRSKDSNSEIGTVPMEDQATIELDTADGGEREAEDNIGQQQVPLLRMVGDGYNWKKYEDKVGKGNENQVSYYKCTHPNCYVKKKVGRTLEGKIVEINYQGTHTHHKLMNNMKRNSSSEYLYSVVTSESVTSDLPDQSLDQYPNEI